MVYLAITTDGLLEALQLANANREPVWCGANAIGEQDFEALEANLTRFTYSLSHSVEESIQRAVETIEEHHPGERVWIEPRSGFNSSLHTDPLAGQ